ncbi:TRAM domain-containing protein [Natrinema sp. DC36]|uniref:TRAM domain-containing protein n=1 Tax=Natrinema sp. DC36 TaxID=2878680 RepID=UPI001CF01EDE|nr:TRAM domain-containing protein [Natrinema sp. DC36]
MEVPDQLLCLFSTQLKEEDGNYIIEVPAREISKGQVEPGQIHRVAVIQTQTSKTEDRSHQQSRVQDESEPKPPVEEGEQRTVVIEDLGDQGDGITRVERGYVIIVPGTEPSERVTIKIKNIRDNVAFGEVIKRYDNHE